MDEKEKDRIILSAECMRHKKEAPRKEKVVEKKPEQDIEENAKGSVVGYIGKSTFG